MEILRYPQRENWSELTERAAVLPVDVISSVREMLTEIKARGEIAIREYAKKFDRSEVTSLRCTPNEIRASATQIDNALKRAIEKAFKGISTFHSAQKTNDISVETHPGVLCWRRTVPLGRVGLYIPGGSAPLFSTALMLGIPATLAGCREIVLASPPDSEGSISPAIAYVAELLGISEVYRVGGVQAIGLFAYGMNGVSRVDKIFGPGNAYVTAAKEIVAGEGVAIDIPAGPSEVLVIADEGANPRFVAADLLSQAEHGPDSQVVVVTTDPDLLERILQEVEVQCEALPRRDIARQALIKSRALLMTSLEEAIEFSNLYAPEHLILAVRDPHALAMKVYNAGSVFLGNYTPESVGDYASGTNHTLPTSGYARSYSGVSLESFQKRITFQELTREGLLNLGPTVETMAEGEGLSGHAQAVRVRYDYD